MKNIKLKLERLKNNMEEFEIDAIIETSIETLVAKLRKEGFDVDYDDVQYSFMNREEYVYIKSDKLYEEEWLPNRFGVYRGYAGGGIHSNLVETELDNMRKNRVGKAKRILGYFRQCYDEIMSGLVAMQGDVEPWESVAL